MLNNYIGRSREYTQDITEANRQLEYYRLMYFEKKKPDKGGEQHLLDRDGVKSNPYFRCDKTKPDCAGARSCKHTKKADRSDINSKEVIDVLFQSLKDAKKNRHKEITGSQHVMDRIAIHS